MLTHDESGRDPESEEDLEAPVAICSEISSLFASQVNFAAVRLSRERSWRTMNANIVTVVGNGNQVP